MQNKPRSIGDIMTTCDTEMVGVLLAVLSIVWGGWVALPFYDTFASAISYGGLAQVAPEWVWGIVVLALGLWNLWLVCRGSATWQRRAWLLNGAQGAFMGYEWLLSNPASAFTLCFFAHAGFCAWLFYRLRAHKVREQAEGGEAVP